MSTDEIRKVPQRSRKKARGSTATLDRKKKGISRRAFMLRSGGVLGGLVLAAYATPTLSRLVIPAPFARASGCTPGFWKHFTNEFPSPYTASTPFTDVFDAGVHGAVFNSLNLEQALRQGGGCEKALGRHGVAALLNAAKFPGTFGLSVSVVISQVNTGLASASCAFIEGIKDNFDALNNSICNLGGRIAD